MDKKAGVWILVFVVFLCIPFTSAASFSSQFYFLQDGAQGAVDMIVSVLAPFFDAILGEYTGQYGDFTESEMFFIRILLFIIIFILIHTALKTTPKIKENNAAVMVIALAISIIGIRFMSTTELFFGAMLPYGVLAVAITTILPFLIFFYFLHSTGFGTAGRRLAWIFFGIVFIALWISKSDNLSETSNYIYVGGIAAIALVFTFDRAIHRYFALNELSVFFKKSNQKAVASLQSEYLNILNVDTPQAKARRTDIENQLRTWGADIP